MIEQASLNMVYDVAWAVSLTVLFVDVGTIILPNPVQLA